MMSHKSKKLVTGFLTAISIIIKEVFCILTVDLQAIRKVQENRKRKPVTLDGNLFDLVDYAQIERDHAVFLRLMINVSPYVLKTQYSQFIGKSRTHGNNLIRFLIDRKFVGVGEYRGLEYLYPLRKAMIWFEDRKDKDIVGYRPAPSEKRLLENFHKAEYVIKKGNKGLAVSFITDIENYLAHYDFPDINVVKRTNDKVFQRKSIHSTDQKEFSEETASLLKKGTSFMGFDITKETMNIITYIFHKPHYDSDDLCDYFSGIYLFLSRFRVKNKNVKFHIFMENDYYKEDVRAYYQKAMKKMNRSYSEMQTLNETINFKMLFSNTDISRYFFKEVNNDHVSEAEEIAIKNNPVPT